MKYKFDWIDKLAAKSPAVCSLANTVALRLVQIDGFTDSVGSDSFNQGLSQRLADAVRYQLASRGVSSTRIGTRGYGTAYPVASNSESSGRQLNRRVEVVIGADTGAAVAARGS